MLNDDNRDIQIKVLVNKKELEQIKKNAASVEKTVSAYLRETALNMCVININNSCITEHTNEISAYRNAINQLIFTIKKTGNYTPVDLEYILDKTNEILKSEKDFINIYRKSVESEKNLISRTVRNNIKKQTEK